MCIYGAKKRKKTGKIYVYFMLAVALIWLVLCYVQLNSYRAKLAVLGSSSSSRAVVGARILARRVGLEVHKSKMMRPFLFWKAMQASKATSLCSTVLVGCMNS